VFISIPRIVARKRALYISVSPLLIFRFLRGPCCQRLVIGRFAHCLWLGSFRLQCYIFKHLKQWTCGRGWAQKENTTSVDSGRLISTFYQTSPVSFCLRGSTRLIIGRYIDSHSLFPFVPLGQFLNVTSS
jgi:hypothetical protein